jgi:radical SAM superfamily enzyme YgiQ (UPF0313 family)
MMTLMNILIIENVWMGGAKYGFFDKTLLTTFSILPTLHARQIAAMTPKKHLVTVLNERYTPINFDEPYDLININFTTSTASHAYEIADIFREKGKTVVLSGYHASALPDEAKQHADSVLLGRGETNWPTLLEDLENHQLKPFYQPAKYDESIRIPPANIQLPGFVVTGAIEATRGCPYQCTFCPETSMPGSRHYYMRPIDEVIAEIKAIPQKTLMFYDTSLTTNPEYSKTLFREMKGLHKRFFCNGNADVLAHDKELVQLSKEAGCVAWLIGFESISQTTIDTIGKKTNKVAEYIQAVNNIHDQRMVVIGCFIFGFDTDTPDIFNTTLKTLQELQIDAADFCILTPFPGTPIFHQLEKEGRVITTDWNRYNMKNVVFQPKQMTMKELLAGTRKMYTEFYSTAHTVKRIVKNLKRGVHPFFLVVARNVIIGMSIRKLFSSNSDAS